jgi:hypothetical protein
VQPLNSHDEIMSVNDPSFSDQVEMIVNDFIEEMKSKVPLIAMKWRKHLASWADK